MTATITITEHKGAITVRGTFDDDKDARVDALVLVALKAIREALVTKEGLQPR